MGTAYARAKQTLLASGKKAMMTPRLDSGWIAVGFLEDRGFGNDAPKMKVALGKGNLDAFCAKGSDDLRAQIALEK